MRIRAAKADGRWEKLYVVGEMEVPERFLAALASKRNVKAFFETLNKSIRCVFAYELMCAKESAARQRRFAKFIDMHVRKETPR